MVLNWTGDAVSPDELAPQLYTPGRRGTFQAEMVTAARRRGRVAFPVGDLASLLTEVAAGHPVVVLQNLRLSWYALWHYAVVIGYALPPERLILPSGREPNKAVPLRVFVRTWQRADSWAQVVLSPDELPGSASEDLYLEAVLGLESARQWEAAARAYDAALGRWPDSLVAWIGLGNSRYAAGDLSGAESAFRRATTAHPDAPSGFNNLAHVLAERGRSEEALAAARRALLLGGPDVRIYEQTLQEVQADAP
jgi:tetratricopeptide (TPR) repeat protein